MPKPKPSEWGKLNAGQRWGFLAIDFGRALFGVNWPKYTAPIVFYLYEHSWAAAKKIKGGGWPDPIPCPINFNQLASRWGFPRQRVYEARDWLLENRVILADGGNFWLNKDAHRWGEGDPSGPDFRPLMAPGMLVYCVEARTRKDANNNDASDTSGRDKSPSHKEPSVTPQRDNVSHQSVTSCHSTALHDVTVERDNVSHQSVTPRVRDTEERAELALSIGASSPASEQGVSADASPEILEPFVPPGSPPTLPMITGPGRDSAEARELVAWAAKLGSDPIGNSYAWFAAEQCDFTPAPWVRGILERKVAGVARRPNVQLLTTLLARCRDAGSCEFAPAPKPAAQIPFNPPHNPNKPTLRASAGLKEHKPR